MEMDGKEGYREHGVQKGSSLEDYKESETEDRECFLPEDMGFRMPEKRCYTVDDLMLILECGRLTVYDLLRRNEFRYIKLGGSGYRISRKSFDEWLDNKGL